MAITDVKNAGIYSDKHNISSKLGEALQSQTTGKIPLGKRQVNQAISMQSEFCMEKVKGAIQNIGIARSFLLTAQANLGTVVDSLNVLAGDIMTLLNQVVPSANNQAAVNKIIGTLGMMHGPISRDQEEGIIIKTLRQGGVGQALYFRVETRTFASQNHELNVPAAFTPDSTVTETGNKLIDPAATAAGTYMTGNVLTDPVVKVKGTMVPTDADAANNKATYQIEVSFGNTTYTSDAAVEDGLEAGNLKLVNKAKDAVAADDTLTLAVGASADDIKGANKTQKEVNEAAAKIQADILQALTSGEWIPTHLDSDKAADTKGIVDFKLSADSNYGTGEFNVKYDGMNVVFRDSYDTLIQSYPLDRAVIKEAAQKAKDLGGTVEVPIGTVGALYVNEEATGEAPADGFTFTTKGIDFKAGLIVSSNDGTRTIVMPDITDPVRLWGEKIIIDGHKLQTDMEYQQQIKGMVDHASQLVRDTYQNVSNLVGALEQDLVAQNAALQSLHDLNDAVTEANAVEVASDVFETTQQYRQLLNSLGLISSVQAAERKSANEIANLAASGA